MTTTPIRRLAAGTVTALLAAGLLAPAAIAVADELPVEDPTTMVLDGSAAPSPAEQAAESAVEPEPASAGGEAAPIDSAETPTAEAAPSEQASDQPSEQAAVKGRAAEPTASAAASASLAASVLLAPGEIRDITVPVADAQRYTVYALGEHIAGNVRTVGGQNYVLAAFGGYSANNIVPSSPETGDVVISLQNTGTTALAVPYGFAFVRTGSPLSTFVSGVGTSNVSVDANVGRAGLTGQVRMVDIDGTSTTLPMAPIVAGSTSYRASFGSLAPGHYLFEVSFDIDGVTHQRVIVAHAAAPETTPPSVEYTTEPAASNASGWFRRTVTASLAASDAGAGVWRLFVGLNATPAAIYSPRTNVVITSEGVHTLSYYAEDYQNNVSSLVSRTIRIDLTAPTVTLDGLEEGQRIEQDAEVEISYDCTDALSGIADCRAPIASGELLDTSTPGTHTFTVVGLDRAGNDTRIERSYTVVGADTTAPEVRVEVPTEPESGWHTDAVTLRFLASDAESDIALIRWEYGTGSGVVIDSTTEATGELTLTETGRYTVLVWAEDAAGNASEPHQLEVWIDRHAAGIALSSPEDPNGILPNGHYAQHERVVIDFACTDRGSGIARCDATTPSGELLPTGTPGTHELRVVATDVAGNRTERVLSYTVDAVATAASRDPRLAQTGAELVLPGIVLVAVLLAAGAMLLTTRRLGGR
jgi:hypothetical protein